MSTRVYTKNPDDEVDYYIDWTPWLAGDTISTSQWTIPDGLTKISDSISGSLAVIWLGDGVSSTNYIAVNTIVTGGGRTGVDYLTILVKSPSNLTYLIPFLRLKIGDTDNTSYRYIDKWLLKALVLGTYTLGKWMNFKYLLDDDYNIYRNPNGSFIFAEPPIIEPADQSIIVTMAAYIILEGSLENSAWEFGSWRDAEIAYSNIETSKARSRTLDRLWNELESMLIPPSKRLAHPLKGTLPGYKDNVYEVGNMDF